MGYHVVGTLFRRVSAFVAVLEFDLTYDRIPGTEAQDPMVIKQSPIRKSDIPPTSHVIREHTEVANSITRRIGCQD